MNSTPQAIILHGTAVSGIGKSRSYTTIPWVKALFLSKTGIDPSLGTFNVKISDEDLPKLAAMREAAPIELPPSEQGYCLGRAVRVRVARNIAGAAVFPCVDNYPEWQLEIVAGVNIRETLGLNEEDLVEIEVLWT